MEPSLGIRFLMLRCLGHLQALLRSGPDFRVGRSTGRPGDPFGAKGGKGGDCFLQCMALLDRLVGDNSKKSRIPRSKRSAWLFLGFLWASS